MISVVIPVRFAESTLPTTVADVLAGPADEVVVAVSTTDSTATLVAELAAVDARVRMVRVPDPNSVPQLRLAGYRACRGEIIAFTEDHCRLAPDWPAPLAAALQDRSVGVAGGPVPNSRSGSMTDRAIYASRYAVFAPPVQAGPCAALPGTSIAYRRETLERFLSSDAPGLWEFELNLSIAGGGLTQEMVPEAWASHGKPYRFLPYCALRMRHGRCFAGRRRAAGASVWTALRTPLLPVLLSVRTLRALAAKSGWASRLALLLPVAAIHFCWALGELIGYLAGSGRSCSETD